MVVSRYLVLKNYSELDTDALALLGFKGEDLGSVYSDVNEYLGGLLTRVAELGDFKGELREEEVITLYSVREGGPRRVILVGGGELGSADYEVLRMYAGYAVSRARSLGIKKLGIALRVVNNDPKSSLRALAEGAELANYAFSKYRKDVKLLDEVVVVGREPIEGSDEVLKEVSVIGEAYRLARDLANTPPEEANPDTLEEVIKEVFKDLPNTRVKVLKEKDLRREGLNGIIAVGKGSERRPRLVIIEYRGGGSKWYALVGKGVCFDSGGINLKRSKWITDMKFDKAGAMAVLATTYAVAKLKLPINLVALLPLVENMPSGSAIKPGDIIRMYNGLTVEIVTTDAEGRLILADSIAYAVRNYRPEFIIDLATLTGSIVVALGNQAAGLFSNDEGLAKLIEEASKESGERVWRMPLWREYFDDIKSEVADIKNLGYERVAGAQAGAAFLAKFTEGTKWAHLDIAGTAWTQDEGPKKPYYPKGATGYGIRLLINLLKKLH